MLHYQFVQGPVVKAYRHFVSGSHGSEPKAEGSTATAPYRFAVMVLSRTALLALLVALVGAVALLDVVARRLGRSRVRRTAGAAGVLGHGIMVLAYVGSDGAFGVSVAPPLPDAVTTALFGVSLVCIVVSLASLYRWRRDSPVAGSSG